MHMQQAQKRKTGISRLLEIANRKKVMVIISGISVTIHAVLSLVPYLMVYYIIQELSKPSINYQQAETYLLYAVYAAIISMIFYFLSGILSHIAAFDILAELRKFIAKKVGLLPMGYLSNKI